MRKIVTLCLMLLTGAATLGGAEIRTKAEPESIDLNDSFQYQLNIINGKLAETPSLPKGSYTIGRLSSGFQSYNLYGRESFIQTYSWSITPTQGGRITIPAFQVKTDDGATHKTRAVSVTVRSAQPWDPRFFMELTPPKETIYPQQTFTLTLNIYAARMPGRMTSDDPFPKTQRGAPVWPTLTIPWLSGPKGFKASDYNEYLNALKPQTFKGFTINNVSGGFFGQTKAKFPLTRKAINRKGPDGVTRDYLVYTLSRTMMAAEFGSYTFPGVTAKNYILYPDRDPPYKEIFVCTPPFSVRVIPPPEENRPATYTGGIGNFSITTKATPTKVNVGTPISLEIHFQGRGNLATIAPLVLSDQEAFAPFKVYDDPQVGDLNNPAARKKVYIYKIRPTTDTVTEIPRVAFSFFEPVKETYQTVYSEPIPLSVKKSEGVGDATIVTQNNTSPRKKEGQELKSTGRGIQADHSSLNALVSQTPFTPLGPPLIWLGLLPALLYAATAVFVTWHRKAHGDPLKKRAREAGARARRKMAAARKAIRSNDAAACYSHLGACLKGYIADRLGLSEHGVTNAQIRDCLAGKDQSEETIASVLALLEQCDAARFSSTAPTAAAMQQEQAKAEQCLTALRKAL